MIAVRSIGIGAGVVMMLALIGAAAIPRSGTVMLERPVRPGPHESSTVRVEDRPVERIWLDRGEHLARVDVGIAKAPGSPAGLQLHVRRSVDGPDVRLENAVPVPAGSGSQYFEFARVEGEGGWVYLVFTSRYANDGLTLATLGCDCLWSGERVAASGPVANDDIDLVIQDRAGNGRERVHRLFTRIAWSRTDQVPFWPILAALLGALAAAGWIARELVSSIAAAATPNAHRRVFLLIAALGFVAPGLLIFTSR